MTQDVLPSPDTAWTARRSPESTVVSSRLDETDFSDIAPPEGIPWLGSAQGVFWDPHGADSFVHSLSLAGLAFQPGQRYLDFGCSSGRTVRTLAAAYPDSEWHGCDPMSQAIEWASVSMPQITFHVSPEAPPTEFPATHFNGVIAASVWTHFSKDAGLAWLDEMHRIIDPGGFLAFSAAGIGRLAYGLRNSPPERAIQFTNLWRRLLREGFVFFPFYAKTGHHGLDTSNWGLARMTCEWVARQISPRWALVAFDPARYGPFQDVYVLLRR